MNLGSVRALACGLGRVLHPEETDSARRKRGLLEAAVPGPDYPLPGRRDFPLSIPQIGKATTENKEPLQ